MKKNVLFKLNNKDLYEDQILLDYIYPVLFTCIDDFENMYLSVCYTANASKTCWLLAKVDPSQVINLLSNKKTIREMFECDNLWNLYKIGNDTEIHVEKIENYKTFDQDAFPAEGEYMDADDGEFSEEIKIFQERISTEKYTLKLQKYFEHLTKFVNINLDKMTFSQYTDSYNFQKHENKEQLCALNIIPISYTFKNISNDDNSDIIDTTYNFFNNTHIKEFSNVYVS